LHITLLTVAMIIGAGKTENTQIRIQGIDAPAACLRLSIIDVWANCFSQSEGITWMAKELDRMSLRELQELELKVRKARTNVQDRSRNDLRKKVEAMIADAGFKVSDIFGGRGGKGRTVAAKYANPDDPSETWTGRGRKPRWLNAKVQEGAKIEKFLIK
jgi:DNA-binding protein H-NS